MKCLTLLVLLSLSVSAFAQEEQRKEIQREFSRVLVGISFSPDVAYRTLTTATPSVNTVKTVRDNREKPRFGYTGGVALSAKLNRHLTVETGIQYSLKGYKEKPTHLIYEQPDPSAPLEVKSAYDFHYLEIPLKLHVAFCENKVSLFSAIGLAADFLLKWQRSTTYY